MVDDASTDDTRKLIEKLAQGKENVKTFFHTINKGGGATRNTAVKIASSDVIFCLDSDDILPEGTLGKMYEMIKEKGCDGVGIHRSIKFKGNNTKDVSFINTFGYVGQAIPFDSLIEKPGGPLCPLYSTFMLTRKAFDITLGYPENHGFDTQSFAWRFLANGLKAYTCPETEYLHRINFNKSYYMREYESGKINHNWFKIYEEFFYLFDDETQREILSFDLNDPTKVLSDYLTKQTNIFKKNYLGYIKPGGADEYEKSLVKTKDMCTGDKYWLGVRYFNKQKYNEAFDICESLIKSGVNNGYIHKYLKESADILKRDTGLVNEGTIEKTFDFTKQGDEVNIFVRIVRKLKKETKNKLKDVHVIRRFFYLVIGIKNNVYNYFSEKNEYLKYQEEIQKIKDRKEFVLDLDWGGLGDVLVYTPLPRILKEKYNVDFYLSENCKKVFRHPDTFKICFEMNPYFKGFKTQPGFKYKHFSRDRSFINLILDINGTNIIENLYKQFGIREKALPEIYYKPKKLPEYTSTVLVDLNYISGHKMGWAFNTQKINNHIKSLSQNKYEIEYVVPSKQDIYRYMDMIYSSRNFVTVISGGAALAASLKKEATVFLPDNLRGESIYNFTFKDSGIKYIL